MLYDTSLSFVSLFYCLVFLLKLMPLNPSFYYRNHAFNIHSSCIDIMPEDCSTINGAVQFVLLKALGQPIIDVAVDMETVKLALFELQKLMKI